MSFANGRSLALVLSFALGAGLGVGCKDKAKKSDKKETPATKASAGGEPPSTTAGDSPPSLPPQEASDKALTEHIERMIAETDPVREKALTVALRLENPVAWFSAAFGEEHGVAMAATYANDPVLPGMAKMIRYHRNKFERRKMTIESYDNPEDPNALGLQARALKAMAKPVPLYSVRFSAPGRAATLHLYNFIHDGKRFRYIGTLKDVGSGEPSAVELAKLRMRQRDLARSPK